MKSNFIQLKESNITNNSVFFILPDKSLLSTGFKQLKVRSSIYPNKLKLLKHKYLEKIYQTEVLPKGNLYAVEINDVNKLKEIKVKEYFVIANGKLFKNVKYNELVNQYAYLYSVLKNPASYLHFLLININK